MGADSRFPALLLALWRRELIPLPLDQSYQGAPLTHALEICRASAFLNVTSDGKLTLQQCSVSDKETSPLLKNTDFLKLTSGTTGQARGIRFRASQLLADCTSVCET